MKTFDIQLRIMLVAVSGGLSVGSFYYNTTDAKITKVT